MTETKVTDIKQVEFLREHTLSLEQRQKLIQDKIERAERLRWSIKASEERKLYA